MERRIWRREADERAERHARRTEAQHRPCIGVGNERVACGVDRDAVDADRNGRISERYGARQASARNEDRCGAVRGARLDDLVARTVHGKDVPRWRDGNAEAEPVWRWHREQLNRWRSGSTAGNLPDAAI